ncbi:MAG: hypothetical protein JNK33_00100 [Candidatus Doudnabacteria bacterium]|nr:hypothetical protein [Candidatus Doudnabacteria bacterium]
MANPEILELYDFLSAPSLPSQPEAAVVFGRADPLVAHALGDLIIPSLVTTAVITGGVGKDSGDIIKQGFTSEAHYLHVQLEKDAHNRNYTTPTVLLEPRATNGGENARFSLAMLTEAGVTTTSLTTVAHAPSARRLSETLQHEGRKINGAEQTVHVKPTDYPFDPKNPSDREEALAEFARLIEWPAKGWLGEQNLPPNLVDYVIDQGTKTPRQPSPFAGAILRLIPPGPRVWLLDKLK